MVALTTAERGDGFLAQRLQRALDMNLRRRVGIRDWVVAVLVVCVTLLLPGVQMNSWAFAGLLAFALAMIFGWSVVFPRLPEHQALLLEKTVNLASSFALLALVAASGGAASPYVYFLALTIIFVAAFIEPGVARVVLIAVAAACALAPIVYDTDAALQDEFVATIIASVSFWIAAAVLIALKRDSAVRAEQEARRAAYVDPLTGAATRRALEEFELRLQQSGSRSAVVWIHVVGVDAVNREHGHLAGDVVLTRVVSAMRAASNARDQVARLGGVDFAVLLPDAGEDAAEAWMTRFGERLLLESARAADGIEIAAQAGAAADVALDAGIELARRRAAAVGPRAAAAAPSSDAERATHLEAQLERATHQRRQSAIESFGAPSGVPVAAASAALLGLLIGLTGGAESIFLSAAILHVAWFACFGSRNESIAATVLMILGAVVAVLAAAPVSATDQIRTFSILATMAALADNVQRNARRLSVAERRAAELSLVDEQTGIGNRTAFERALAQILPRRGHPSRVERIEGRPAVVAIDIGGAPGTAEMLAAAAALRDAVGAGGDVYRIGASDFAVVTRAHHEQYLAELAVRCQRALEGDELLARAPGSVLAGAAIHESAMSAAELTAAAVANHPRSVWSDERQYA